MPKPQIVWFRQDLRLDDQHALINAAQAGPILGLYIWDQDLGGDWAMGSASKWWLHHSLKALKSRFEDLGGAFILRKGNSLSCLKTVFKASGADAIHATRHCEPWQWRLEQDVQKAGLPLTLHPNALLYEPGAITTEAGTPYKVFTPFWKAVLAKGDMPPPHNAPRSLSRPDTVPGSDDLNDWGLTPKTPNWAEDWPNHWSPGEEGAKARFDHFLKAAPDYGKTRNRTDEDTTSRLSPHLHFGEISARRIWHRLTHVHEESGVRPYLRQLAWRDFSHHLLTHDPTFADRSWNIKFRTFPWAWTHEGLSRWQQGTTGFPIIDAAMRQLWQRGWMHNRTRMIVASFLTKNMLVHWRVGEAWFWDTLVDADLANNAAGWQWTAGSGADAAPYFRIFNPIRQAEKFDPEGAYVRTFVPELNDMPKAYIHAPWKAPEDILEKAGVVLGKTYPHPMLDLKATRDQALAAYQKIKPES